MKRWIPSMACWACALLVACCGGTSDSPPPPDVMLRAAEIDEQTEDDTVWKFAEWYTIGEEYGFSKMLGLRNVRVRAASTWGLDQPTLPYPRLPAYHDAAPDCGLAVRVWYDESDPFLLNVETIAAPAMLEWNAALARGDMAAWCGMIDLDQLEEMLRSCGRIP